MVRFHALVMKEGPKAGTASKDGKQMKIVFQALEQLHNDQNSVLILL